MTTITTSITSGLDFIGKTLIIGSTGLVDRDYSYILDFNNNSTNNFITANYQFTNQQPMIIVRQGYDNDYRYPHIANIGTYYIYVLSFISTTEIKYNIYEYNAPSTIISKGTTITTFNTQNSFLSTLTQFWLGRSIFGLQYYYSGTYDKVALYNGNIFALTEANILSTLLILVRSTQTNIINNNNNTYTFRSLGTNFLGVVVNILNYNATPGSSVTNSNITLIGTGITTGGYLNIIGIYRETTTIPNAPTNVIATAGIAQITITWSASTYDGGSAIIGYNVSTNAGYFQLATFVDSSTTTATFTEIPFTEVPIGTAFTFIVVAINAIGNSAPASSLSITPIRTPNAPTNVRASAGNSQVTLNWTAPTSNGGSAIISYNVTSSPGNFQATTADGSTTTATISGLTNGTAYTFTVVATNAIGNSAPASSLSVTPLFTVPSAPTNVTAITLNSQAIVSWTASTNDGGSAITSYRVTSSPGNFQVTTANGSTTTATISVLTNGTGYTFTVVATNVAGSSPASIATNYENFNNSSKSFRIYCDKLTSNDISNNLRLTSSNKNIELKVVDGKKIIFKNDVMFNNSSMDFSNNPLTGLRSISAESLNLINILKKSNVNIVNKSQFYDVLIEGSYNRFLTRSNLQQDLSKSFFNSIDIVNKSSVIVDLNVTLYCCIALNERITIELWRDASMLMQSKDLGSVIAAGGMPIPYNITYLDENLTAGLKKYYIKYKLENNSSTNDDDEYQGQGIINVRTSEVSGYASIILTEVTNNSNHSNKIIFDNSNLATTLYEIQDLSALFFNTIEVNNSNVQVNINANLLCCYGLNERLNIEVWRDASMIAQSINLGTINSTNGLTIPYSFNYLDTNLSNGPKKYYLKYKLEQNTDSSITNSTHEQGIVNLSTLNSIGTSNILLRNVAKINANLLINNNNNNTSFLTTSAEYQDLSGQLFNNIELDNTSAVIVDLNITLFCCYAANERITVQLWRDLSMVSENTHIGNSIATSGLTINYKLSLLDEQVSAGIVKYYLKYKLESNLSGQPQGIINVTGGYNIIEQSNIGSNIGVSYKVLSYTSMDYINEDAYIKNTKIGYNPIIPGDKGSSSGRRGAYFTYIDVAGSDSHFNDSLYVNKNIHVDGPTSITIDLSVNGISLATMFDKLSIVKDYSNNVIPEFSNNRIKARDLSATNITISNELYVLNKYYANDLNISGQLLSDVLKVPHEFTLDGSLVVNGNLIVRGNKKTIKSSIIDISAFTLKVANNLRNKADLLNNPAGLDVSYIAALHYNGTRWNVSGGNLLVNNMSVGLDVSLINLQTTISNTLIASKLKYDSSFALLQSNIDNSFANLYTISQLDNSYVTIRYSNTKVSDLKNYIDLSFVTKQVFSISGQYIVQNYVTKAYVDGSFSALNSRLDLSFVLKKNVELSYNDLSGQIINFFATVDAANIKPTNFDISSITIETIKTPKLALTSHVLINGDLIVGGDTSCNSLNISNTFTFSNNGYSSIYRPSSNPETIIEEYYSKFNNFGNFGKVLYILADGSLYYQTGKGAISDIRLKENIVDASPKLEDLLKVRIVDYNLKNNSHKKYIGVVAQELEELFPSLVSEDYVNANTNAITNANAITNTNTKYKSVKYSCFNVMLIKALQEQQQIITSLALRLERLQDKKKQLKENA